jgi:predicted ester cyclase
MSREEENKARRRRALEEVLIKQNLEVIPELFHADWMEHRPEGELKHGEGAKNTEMFYTAFPDLNITVDDMIAEGDKTVTRLAMSGTFTGEFRGIPPTGNEFSSTGILITQWLDGKEKESWMVYDQLNFFLQLGIPIPE